MSFAIRAVPSSNPAAGAGVVDAPEADAEISLREVGGNFDLAHTAGEYHLPTRSITTAQRERLNELAIRLSGDLRDVRLNLTTCTCTGLDHEGNTKEVLFSSDEMLEMRTLAEEIVGKRAAASWKTYHKSERTHTEAPLYTRPNLPGINPKSYAAEEVDLVLQGAKGVKKQLLRRRAEVAERLLDFVRDAIEELRDEPSSDPLKKQSPEAKKLEERLSTLNRFEILFYAYHPVEKAKDVEGKLAAVKKLKEEALALLKRASETRDPQEEAYATHLALHILNGDRSGYGQVCKRLEVELTRQPDEAAFMDLIDQIVAGGEITLAAPAFARLFPPRIHAELLGFATHLSLESLEETEIGDDDIELDDDFSLDGLDLPQQPDDVASEEDQMSALGDDALSDDESVPSALRGAPAGAGIGLGR